MDADDDDEEFETVTNGNEYHSPDVNGQARNASDEEIMEEIGDDEDIPLVSG